MPSENGFLASEANSATTNVSIDMQRQEAARAYAREHRRLLVIDLGISALVVIGFLVTGASSWLKMVLQGAGLTSPWALVGAYIALTYVGYTALFWPLSWWSGYVLPHRYDLSTQTPRGWLADELKSLGLGLVLGVPVAEAIYWFLRSYPDTWWLWASAFLLACTILLGYVMPVLILPLFYKLTPLDDADLVGRIRRLGEQAATRVVGVYSINLSSRTKAANAMVMGLGHTKRIALGDTLRQGYTADEIEVIVAHELGHQVHHDLELSIVVQSALLVGSLYLAQLFLSWGVARFGFAGPGDVAALPLLALAVGLFSLVTLPLSNGYSRWRESMADRYSIRVSGRPLAFAQAMTRLANQNLAELNPPRWVVWLLYSHPPIEQRIRLGREMAQA